MCKCVWALECWVSLPDYKYKRINAYIHMQICSKMYVCKYKLCVYGYCVCLSLSDYVYFSMSKFILRKRNNIILKIIYMPYKYHLMILKKVIVFSS